MDAIRMQVEIARAQAAAVRVRTQGNPPPEGMSSQEAAEVAMSGAIADRRLDRARAEPFAVRAGASVLQGLPFVGEYVDEAVGVVGGTDRLRAIQEANAIDAPVMNTVGQVAGGIVGSVPLAAAAGPALLARVPASLAGRVLTGAGAGAAVGGVEGAVSGYGAGNEGDRGDAATVRGAIGAGLGGVVGAAAPLVAAGASNIVRNVRGRPDAAAARRLGGSPESAEVVGRILANDDPAQVAARIAAGGDRAMVGDAGPATAGLLDTAIQRAGPGGRVARDAIEQRAIGSARDINEALDVALGRVGESSSTALVPYGMKPSAVRARFYKVAYDTPIDYSAAAGREIEELLPRVPGGVIARANNLMRVEGVTSRQILADVAEDGSVTFREMPDVRQLDYITRALNDVAKRGDGQGVLGGNTNEGRIYAGLSRDIRNAMKEAVPPYKRALDQAATEIGQKEALELGSVALRPATSRGELAELVADMSQVERAKLRQGVRSYIDDTLSRVRRTAGGDNQEAREGLRAMLDLSSRDARQKLRIILGDDAATVLTKRLDQASKSFELRARTADNSRTFARQNMDEAISELTQPGMIGELLSGSPVQATRKLVQFMTNMTPQARRAVEERITGEIATMLTQRTGPDAQAAAAQLVQMLQRAPITESLASRIGQATGTSVAVGGYQTGTRSLSTQ